MALVPLSLGDCSFARLRQSREIYVDKTAQLYSLARQPGGAFLFCRPRRFGKTMLLTTFQSLFAQESRFFDALAIASAWRDQPKYPVLRLDLSFLRTATTRQELLSASDRMLSFACDEAGIYQPSGKDSLETLAKIIKSGGIGNLVLLIDEYDAPLTRHLDCPDQLKLQQEFLAELFSLVGNLRRYLRFLWITGISNWYSSGLFDGLPGLIDLSWAPQCATLTGFSEEEIAGSFDDHLTQVARANSQTTANVLAGILDAYQGYRFSLSETVLVCNPWEVLSFLAQPQRGWRAHWWKTGCQTEKMIAGQGLSLTQRAESYFAPKELPCSFFDDHASLSQSKELKLLLETGYLTIAEVKAQKVLLRYSNREVEHSFALLVARSLLPLCLQSSLRHLELILSNGSISEATVLVQKVIETEFQTEIVFHQSQEVAAVLALLIAALSSSLQVKVLEDRSSFIVIRERHRWVFSVKQDATRGFQVQVNGMAIEEPLR